MDFRNLKNACALALAALALAAAIAFTGLESVFLYRSRLEGAENGLRAWVASVEYPLARFASRSDVQGAFELLDGLVDAGVASGAVLIGPDDQRVVAVASAQTGPVRTLTFPLLLPAQDGPPVTVGRVELSHAIGPLRLGIGGELVWSFLAKAIALGVLATLLFFLLEASVLRRVARVAALAARYGTLRKRLLRELKRRRALTASLRDERQRSARALAAKSDFLAKMSHEIRTPLASILGFSELLRGTAASGDWDQGLAAIRRNGEYLLALVNDVLEFSEIESGRVTLCRAEESVSRIALDIEAIMEPKARAKGLSFEMACEAQSHVSVLLDGNRVREILFNLIENAVKFTSKGGVRVSLSVRANEDGEGQSTIASSPPMDSSPRAEIAAMPEPALEASQGTSLQAPGWFVVKVEDTGLGIPGPECETIFNTFYKRRSDARKEFGAGLGLAVARHLARLMGGDVTVSSRVGQGSTFTLRVKVGVAGMERVQASATRLGDELELLAAGAGAGAASGAGATQALPGTGRVPVVRPLPSKTLTGLHVLVADDAEDTLLLLRRILEASGAHVELAKNGKEAFERVIEAERTTHPFDLVLTDVMMPEWDGTECTQMLRRSGFQKPVIALTANGMAQDREACMLAGCSGFITKPVSRNVLIDCILATCHV